MTHQVHFAVGVKGTTLCATRAISASNKVILNNRVTYRGMTPVAVGPEEFRNTPAADRCAHCEARFTQEMNRRRAISGKPAYANAMTKELA